VGQCVGAQGRPKEAKISKTCLLYDVTSRNTTTENEKHIFSIMITRLAESVDGLDSSIASRVIGLQSSARFGAFVGLKRLGLFLTSSSTDCKVIFTVASFHASLFNFFQACVVF